MKKLLLIASMMLNVFAKAQWSEMGGLNGLSANGGIFSVCKDASGNKYTAGDFTNISGKRYVAKWDGTVWSELGGLNGLSANAAIWSLCSDAFGNIYAGGDFRNSSNKGYLAKWDGSTWSELGGLNGLSAYDRIRSICSDAFGNIYVAGDLKNSSGKCYVAKWDGAVWSELGGLNGLSANMVIESICSDALGNIYAGGGFTNSSSNQYVAKWDGTSWSELGGVNSLSAYWIYTIWTDHLGNVYAGGAIVNSSGKNYVAKWNGTFWSEVGGLNGLSANNAIHSIFTDTLGNVYAAGRFTNGSSYLNGNQYVAKYNGTSWSELGGTNNSTFNSFIYSVMIDTAGNVYAAGEFNNANGKYYVAKYAQPLPLKLLYFTAQMQATPNTSKEGNVVLNWQTANEVNVSHINIQRSIPEVSGGSEFTTIGKVNVGSSLYLFLDEKLPNINSKLTLYYRLEIVDKDGSKTYSEVKEIRLSQLTNKLINLFPNPAKGFATISCKGMKEVKIINSSGQEISQQKPRNDALFINTIQLPKGIYIVKAIMNNGEVKTEKLLVE